MKEEYIALAALIKSSTALETEEHEDDYEYHFAIRSGNNVYWILFAKDESEATVGFNSVHEHFDDESNTPKQGLEYFKFILSHDIMTITFYRGNCNYKTTYELLENNRRIPMGSVLYPCFRFWRKKTVMTAVNEKVMGFV